MCIRVRVPRRRDPGSASLVNEEDFLKTAASSQDPSRESRSLAPLQSPQRDSGFDVIRRNDHPSVQRFRADDNAANHGDKHKRDPNARENCMAT
jgi:hypothetical protein